MDQLFDFQQGTLPLLISVPHAGTDVPEEIRVRMTDAAAKLPDTDWFVPRLYDFDSLDDASWLVANVSRYVVDLNRPPDNENLYPGQNTTGLCPETNFDGTRVYKHGESLTAGEIEARVEAFWRPYHRQLQRELESIRGRFGFAVLLDLHSIASRVPNLFPGTLPDINLGTNRGKSVEPSFQSMLDHLVVKPRRYSTVMNERFVGGYITRHYGDPSHRIEALQIELSQATYLDERTGNWDPVKVAKIQIVLQEFVQTVLSWATPKMSRAHL
jgi:N-formylglutamate deformylase